MRGTLEEPLADGSSGQDPPTPATMISNVARWSHRFRGAGPYSAVYGP